MKKSLLLLLALSVSLTGSVRGQESPSKKAAVDQTAKKAAIGKVAAKAEKKPMVQIAILLDNSGSMSGLIDQARSELWKVVNEFVTASVDGVQPELQVAVYHYGNPPATMLVELTDDLDKVSESLFGISVAGGSEHCGEVIQAATDGLKWSEDGDDLKLIFIAGNEPFTQGSVDYRVACKAAISKGIMINTIHCGNGIPEGWKNGALLADGQAMNIDHTRSVVHIEAPQDKKIAELGVKLNETYIAYGKHGAEGAARQEVQDSNASGVSASSSIQRGVSKANAYYKNSKWDLCDACIDKTVDLAKIPVEDLPENMRKMTVDERKKYIDGKIADREKIRKDINELNDARKKHVAEKRKEMAEKSGEEGDTLDEAVIGAIRSQAKEKKYSFGDEKSKK